MTFFNDAQLTAHIRKANPLASDVRDDGFQHKKSAIQACTLDLTVGDIFQPGKASGPGSHTSPLNSLSLGQGETAVVRTFETLNVPGDIGAISFPPAHMSVQGILMTSPGHVDPGYSGKMHFTVINMGSKPYELRQGDRIVRVLFFPISQAVAPYDKRNKASASTRTGIISEEILDRLSSDFLNVTDRAESAAKKAVGRAEIVAKYVVPIIATFVGAFLAFLTTAFLQNTLSEDVAAKLKTFDSQLTTLNARFDGMGGQLNLKSLEARINQLENQNENSQ